MCGSFFSFLCWLKALTDANSVHQRTRPSACQHVQGFRLEFHFRQPNPFFSNAVLTKAYEVGDLLNTEESELQAAAG